MRGHPFHLLGFVLPVVVDDGLPFGAAREEVLRDPVPVVRNDRIGHVQDLRRGPVVLVQDHVLAGGELREALRAGAAPLVDRLVGVAHHEEVAVPGRQFLHDLPVVGVAVLRLIHHDVVELLLPPGPCVFEVVEDVVRHALQVVEVEGIVLHLAVDVAGDGRGEHPLRPFHAGQHVGGDVVVQRLGGAHLRQEILHRLLGPFDAQFFHAGAGIGAGIVLVQDRERLRETDPVDVTPEQFHAKTVDRTDKVVVVAAVDHPGDARAHLGGGLVGEGQAEDVRRIDAQHIHQVGIAVGQCLGLARPCAGDDAHPALRRCDGGRLTGVQLL